MVKRERLEIIKDILNLIQNSRNAIKPTPLIRKSNLSTERFNEYAKELLDKRFIREIKTESGKVFSVSETGQRFLEKYSSIKNLIDEFGL